MFFPKKMLLNYALLYAINIYIMKHDINIKIKLYGTCKKKSVAFSCEGAKMKQQVMFAFLL